MFVSKEVLDALFCNMFQGVLVLDRNGKIIFINKGALNSVGESFRLPSNIMENIHLDENVTKNIYFFISNRSLLVNTMPLYFNDSFYGLMCVIQNVKSLRKILSTPLEDKKRTFIEIRERLLFVLSHKRKTINQIANDSGVNWKTVEKHLTYFVGKGLVEEVFSSEYVRIFELTSKGKELAKDIEERELRKIVKDNFINQKKDLINEVC